jgi:hypothetical protein
MPEEKKRLLKNWLDSYLELTDRTEPPRLFRLWTAISVVASALQRKCKLSRGFQTFYPNMYIVLIGHAAGRKGTALGQGYFFLEELGLHIASDSTSKQALTRKIKSAKTKTLVPENGEEVTHSSITIYAPEFTVLIGYQDVAFLTILVDWYDCGKGKDGVWENDTISRGVEKITGIWVNILAATTPQLLRESLPTIGIGGGFNSRVLYITELSKGKRKHLEDFNEREILLTSQLLEDLKQINELCGEFRFSEECQREFDEWYETRCEEEPRLDQNKFAGYLGRRAAHCYKLMMIVNASRTSSMIIELEDFHKALKLMEEIEVRMEQAFRGFGKFEYSEELGKIITLLQKNERVTRGEIFRLFSNDAPDRVLDGIIESLRVMGMATTKQEGNETVLELVKKNGKPKV